MSSTEGSGGPPIVMSKAPVEKPEIARGHVTVLRDYLSPEPTPGTRVTFTVQRDGYLITAHDVLVLSGNDTFVVVDIHPQTVVTWDCLAAAAPQI